MTVLSDRHFLMSRFFLRRFCVLILNSQFSILILFVHEASYAALWSFCERLKAQFVSVYG